MVELKVECPKCGHRFPLTKALASQIEDSVRHEYEIQAKEQERTARVDFKKRLAAEKEKIESQVAVKAEKAAAKKISALRTRLSQAARREKAARADFDRQLAREKHRVSQEAARQAKASVADQVADLRKQIRDAKAAAAEMQRRESRVRARENQLKTKEQGLQRTVARKIESARRRAIEEASETIEKEHRMRELQHEKMVSDLKKQLTDAKRKLEQTSQQAQGEMYEIELQKALAAAFPEDKVRCISKGKLGADLIHKVVAAGGQHCGTIVWESKNTKNWNNSWLAKLRSDQRREKAEIAVLVSTALPRHMRSHLTQVSGVWVAEFSVAAGLAIALRAHLIELARLRMAARGKTEKMEVLYQYLMSVEFRQRVEAIVEAFVSIRGDLEKEKQATERGWAKREKHLDLVLQNVGGMVGDIQAIAPAFPRIKRLELPAP